MSYVNINRTYFETNYTPTQNTRVECKVSFVSSTTEYEPWIFGRRYSSQSHLSTYSFNCFFFNVSNNLAYHIGGAYNDYGGEYAVGVPYIISLSPTQWTNNGVSTAITSNYQQYSSTGFPIGAAYTVNLNSYQYCLDFNLYYFKIYEGNTLVRNYVPRLYNGVACLYDTIGETYLQPNDSSKTTYVSSLDVSPSSKSFKASGGTQSFTVDAEADWTASTEDSWITLSSSSGTSGTSTVTVTVPSYSGSQKRQGTITFTSGDETVDVTIKQQKPSTSSDTIRIGANAIAGGYVGAIKLATAYIGEQQIWSSGPFTGLTFTSSKTFLASGGTNTLRVKAGADWTITNNADWISLSQISGGTGVTEITITVSNYTSTAENRTAIITASTANVTKYCTVTQNKVYTGPANNEIWYTTTGGTVLSYTSKARAFDSSDNLLTLVSNTYVDGKGVLTYSGDIDHLSTRFFGQSHNEDLSSVDLPASLKQLPDYFIYGNGDNWTSVTINSPLLTYIGHECISTGGPVRFRIDVQEVRGKINFWALWGSNVEGFSCTEASGVTAIGDESNLNPWSDGYTYLRMPNVAVSFKVNNITGMTASAFVDLFNDLATVPSNSKSIKMGASNLALLTEQQKQIATNKGWLLTT